VSDIEEVEVKSNIFTFEDKYQTHKTNHILPANIDEELKNEIIEVTKKTSKSESHLDLVFVISFSPPELLSKKSFLSV
jgi:D-alanine-D-alanine ligase-like ATP-grasp enzyme